MPAQQARSKRRTDLTKIPPRKALQYTDRFSKERLAVFRKHGDPKADAVVSELHRTKGLTNIRDLLGTVQDRAKDQPNSVFAEFLEEVDKVPSWVDHAKVEQGQRVLACYSSVMGPSLLAGSLVGGAMFSSAAAVTALAGNLTEDPARRVNETALIIIHLAFPGQLLRREGKARIALARVRLLHAGLRHWLPASGRYKRTDEPPVNQHDLAITLALFGYVNLRSLALMGVNLSQDEIDSYIHMWKYAGYLLGIEEALLPDTLEDQEEFFLASCIDEAHPDRIPVETKKVLDAIAEKASKNTYGLVPYAIAQRQLHQLTRYLSGNEYCEGMKIEDLGDYHWSIMLAWAMGKATSVTAHYVPFGEAALRNLNLVMTNRMIKQHEAQKGKLGAGINVAPNPFAKNQQAKL